MSEIPYVLDAIINNDATLLRLIQKLNVIETANTKTIEEFLSRTGTEDDIEIDEETQKKIDDNGKYTNCFRTPGVYYRDREEYVKILKGLISNGKLFREMVMNLFVQFGHVRLVDNGIFSEQDLGGDSNGFLRLMLLFALPPIDINDQDFTEEERKLLTRFWSVSTQAKKYYLSRMLIEKCIYEDSTYIPECYIEPHNLLTCPKLAFSRSEIGAKNPLPTEFGLRLNPTSMLSVNLMAEHCEDAKEWMRHVLDKERQIPKKKGEPVSAVRETKWTSEALSFLNLPSLPAIFRQKNHKLEEKKGKSGEDEIPELERLYSIFESILLTIFDASCRPFKDGKILQLILVRFQENLGEPCPQNFEDIVIELTSRMIPYIHYIRSVLQKEPHYHLLGDMTYGLDPLMIGYTLEFIHRSLQY